MASCFPDRPYLFKEKALMVCMCPLQVRMLAFQSLDLICNPLRMAVLRASSNYESEIRAKKDTQTQRFHPKIPCLNPPFLGAFNPRNSLCSGCVFPSKCRKNANTKNFEGGARGAEKKSLC